MLQKCLISMGTSKVCCCAQEH